MRPLMCKPSPNLSKSAIRTLLTLSPNRWSRRMEIRLLRLSIIRRLLLLLRLLLLRLCLLRLLLLLRSHLLLLRRLTLLLEMGGDHKLMQPLRRRMNRLSLTLSTLLTL